MTLDSFNAFTVTVTPQSVLWRYTNADNETFSTVLLASQVVMIQSLQPKGREFESTFVFFHLYSIRLISFIIDVPRPLRNEILDDSISKG